MPQRKKLKTKDGKEIKRPTAKQLKEELAPVLEAIEGELVDPGFRDGYGRPTVMTKAVISKLTSAYMMGCTNREAALFAGIGESTLDKWLKLDPEMKAYFNEIKDMPTLHARKTLTQAIKKSPYFALQYLERKLPKEFGRRVSHTVDIPDEPTDEEQALIDSILDDNL